MRPSCNQAFGADLVKLVLTPVVCHDAELVVFRYCFEYTWIHKGWSFSNRIRYFEENWLYFLGFGCAPHTPYFPIDLVY